MLWEGMNKYYSVMSDDNNYNYNMVRNYINYNIACCMLFMSTTKSLTSSHKFLTSMNKIP